MRSGWDGVPERVREEEGDYVFSLRNLSLMAGEGVIRKGSRGE